MSLEKAKSEQKFDWNKMSAIELVDGTLKYLNPNPAPLPFYYHSQNGRLALKYLKEHGLIEFAIKSNDSSLADLSTKGRKILNTDGGFAAYLNEMEEKEKKAEDRWEAEFELVNAQLKEIPKAKRRANIANVIALGSVVIAVAALLRTC